MRKDFYGIYKDLTRAYTRLPPSRWAFDSSSLSADATPHLIERAILDSLRHLDLQERIRPDALHFLLINMHQMVSLPVLLEAARNRRPRSQEWERDWNDSYKSENFPYKSIDQELRETIRHDIDLILSDAAKFSLGEISGSDILRSAANVYKRLKSAANNTWG